MAAYGRYFALAKKLGIDEEMRRDLVMQYTGKRTESMASMRPEEFESLVRNLAAQARSKFRPKSVEQDRGDTMRKKIFSLVYTMGYMAYDRSLLGRELTPDERKTNQAVIYGMVKRKGYLKKDLMAYTNSELVGLVNQFEAMLKSNIKQEARREVKELLTELNIDSHGRKQR